ncbi:RHS repeat-associated core domain-containing protein [Desulfogranum japonicum]|uniref:RHS repeat-associated core domain-containing protein n=1 Tax=Desulfogranum japonicum TaxID=231447 RepID=UPI000407682D|nr:RHS repeat-associated core domain-containing protein [Desulfogranum japonicum]
MKRRVYTLASLFVAATLCLSFTPQAVQASTQPYISGHQVNFGTGNKYLSATDVRFNSPGPGLSFSRTYNSQSDESSVLGYGWVTNGNQHLIIATSEISVVKAGGRYVTFTADGDNRWINETGSLQVITLTADGYTLTQKDQTTLFDTNGNIVRYTDKNGNSIHYTYTDDLLSSVSNDFGNAITYTYTDGKLTGISSAQGDYQYAYDSNDNLTTVTQPDNTTIQYLYEDSNDVHNLTGVINEENVQTLTVEYDSYDRVIRSAKQGGSQEVTIDYPANYLRTVTNSLGVVTTYHLDVLHGIVKVGSFEGPGCSSCGSTSDTSYLYNDRFQVEESTNGKGVKTSYTYDSDGNKASMTEAVGTELERTTTYTYENDRVKTITEASVANSGQNVVTTLDYDSNGNLKSSTENGYDGSVSIFRTTSYTYNSYGQIKTIDGPRTDVPDVTTFCYYANDTSQGLNRGQLHTVTNAKGHVTTYGDYNALGKAETIIAANGLTTRYTYNDKKQLLSSDTGGLITFYSYDDAGVLQQITNPGNRIITYSYNTAGQIETIADSQGNAITYSYDTEGKNTGRQIKDPDGTLKAYLNFEYDDFGRVHVVRLPGDAERSFDFDEVGNLVTEINATGLEASNDYDALNRITSVALDGKSVGAYYDLHDNLIQFDDPRGNSTTFTYDDFGRKTLRSAPDTGATTYLYDEASNIVSKTDALNRTVTVEYDALNRPVKTDYASQAITYLYDQDVHSTGRVKQINDEFGSIVFDYTGLGQLSREERTIEGATIITGYGYDVTGGLISITYPSGMVVTYRKGSTGQVESVSIDGRTVVSSVTHMPFGPLNSALLGNILMSREYDQRYNLTSLQADTLNYTYEYDKEGHITGITGKSWQRPSALSEIYAYATDSNRLSGKDEQTYAYDAVGNITSNGTLSFKFDALNRLESVEQEGVTIATYGYDYAKRRIKKTVASEITYFIYDLKGNLIAETASNGTVQREYIYLDGELIVQKLYQENMGLYYVINDHLGAPQRMINEAGNIVWKANYLPFGKAQVTLSLVSNNIRFPGQYFDNETGLHYNWHRYYDPEMGRYLTADPIGFEGGDVNFYSYVWQDPLNWIDPWGLSGEAGRYVCSKINDCREYCNACCALFYIPSTVYYANKTALDHANAVSKGIDSAIDAYDMTKKGDGPSPTLTHQIFKKSQKASDGIMATKDVLDSTKEFAENLTDSIRSCQEGCAGKDKCCYQEK